MSNDLEKAFDGIEISLLEDDTDSDNELMPDENTTRTDEGVEDESGEAVEDDEVAEEDDDEEPTSFLDVVFLGETKSLTRDEAKNLAQKGMNYDRINEKYEKVKKFEGREAELEFLEKLSKNNGYESIADMITEYEIKSISKEKNIGLESARALYYKEKANAVKPKSAEELAEDIKNKHYSEFKDEYPDVNIDELPEEVMEEYNKGKRSLVAIYSKYHEKKLKDEIEASKKKKSRSVGSMKSSGKKTTDKWTSGFLD